MRLYTKIALTLGVTGLICTLASVVAVAFIVVPQYLKMDREAALANGARAYEFLQSETDKSMSSVGDWGHWDDTFAFAKTLDKEYIASNLKQEDLETILVDEYVLADYDGTIRFEHAANQSEDAPRVPFAGLKSVPKAHWTDASKFSDREVRAGIALTAAGPAIVALTAITDSNGGGPSPGVLMFVRMVDEEILAALRKKTRLDFALEPVGEKAKPPANAEAAVIDQLRAVFRQPEIVAGTFRAARTQEEDITEADARAALTRLDPLWDELFPAEQARIVTLLVERVEIGTEGLNVRLRMDGLAGLAREMITDIGAGA